MNKLSAILNLLRVGQEVADPVKWKNGQVTANAVSSVLISIISLLDAFGWDLPWTLEAVQVAALVILAAANILLTLVTSTKVGLPAGADDATP